MSYAVGFALFSLLLTDFNDVLFKRYLTGGRSIGNLFLVLVFFGLWLNGVLPKFKIPQSNLIMGISKNSFSVKTSYKSVVLWYSC